MPNLNLKKYIQFWCNRITHYRGCGDMRELLGVNIAFAMATTINDKKTMGQTDSAMSVG